MIKMKWFSIKLQKFVLKTKVNHKLVSSEKRINIVEYHTNISRTFFKLIKTVKNLFQQSNKFNVCINF